MRLFIDDIRDAPSSEWTVARSNTEAVRVLWLYKDAVAEISIDHDISHQVVVNGVSRPYPCNETFIPACHFIGALYQGQGLHAPKVTIHTA